MPPFTRLSLLILAVCTADKVSAEDIGQWARFEVSVTSNREYANPYRDVRLDVTYTRPDGRQIAFWGFHDGDATWKLRFMPDQLGAWKYEAKFSDGSGQASGTFRVTDSLSKTTIEMVEPGVLQAADRWASFTGRARLTPSGSFAALAVTIDRSAAAPGKATATIYLDGARRLEIAIDSAIADTRLNIVSQSK